MLLQSDLLGHTRRFRCPICSAPFCTCKGANEPYVGTPLQLAALRERADGTVTRIRAEQDIFMDKPGQIGAKTLLYKAGDMIREEDIEQLQRMGVIGGAKQQKAEPQDKAERGPREPQKRTRASRDKALSQSKEE